MQGMLATNELGHRGEALFTALITKFWERPQPLFRPQFLGDKWPTVDFYVELVGAGNLTPYFFAQIKTTRRGYTTGGRLKVGISSRDLKRMNSYPAPTYLIGIDEVDEIGYIVSADGEWLLDSSSLATEYPINETNQDLLWHEVLQFWVKAKMPLGPSVFKDPQWKVKL